MNRQPGSHPRPGPLVLAALALAAAAALSWAAWTQQAWPGSATILGDRAALQEWLASYGAWAPLLSIGLNVAQVVFAPIPGQVLGLANGYVFGFWRGVFFSLAGVTIGTGIVLALTRRWGRPLVVRFVAPGQLAKIDRITAQRSELFFFLIMLLPFLPDDLTCFAIGLTNLPLARMMVLIALGRLPGLIVAAWLGASAMGLHPAAWAALGAVSTGAAILYIRFAESVESRLLGWLNKIK